MKALKTANQGPPTAKFSFLFDEGFNSWTDKHLFLTKGILTAGVNCVCSAGLH